MSTFHTIAATSCLSTVKQILEMERKHENLLTHHVHVLWQQFER